MPKEVLIDYEPRPQFLGYHLRTKRWAAIVAHRRAGKTVACVNDLIGWASTFTGREGRFAYLAPTFGQAKDVAWSYLRRYTGDIPGVTAHETELRVDLPNGARIRLYGADNYDRLRGLYLDGIVLDEFADMNPLAWTEVVRPALSDRGGWATFIGTPKGKNKLYEIWQQAREEPDDWFSLQLRASETGIISEEELASARKSMTREQYDQEYECSFDSAIVGAYYGRDMRDAELDGRITSVPYDRSADVVAAWDLGVGDSTAIWIAQSVGREIHLIDYFENSGEPLSWYVDELAGRPYRIQEHILPHDAEAKELQTGKTRAEFLEARGLSCRVLPRLPLDDGISAVRMVLNRCWFDKVRCKAGIEALKEYRAEWDNRPGRQMLHDRPFHNWASHGADAFRYLIMGLDERQPVKWPEPRALRGIV